LKCGAVVAAAAQQLMVSRMRAAVAVVAELIPWQQSVSHPTLNIPLRSAAAAMVALAEAPVNPVSLEAIPVAQFQAPQRQPAVWGVVVEIRGVVVRGLMARVPVVSRPQTITAEMVLLG
jgi:hypothetical protein